MTGGSPRQQSAANGLLSLKSSVCESRRCLRAVGLYRAFLWARIKRHVCTREAVLGRVLASSSRHATTRTDDVIDASKQGATAHVQITTHRLRLPCGEGTGGRRLFKT
eukprot:6193967-Pleurochrysis_carterae.AAC.1